MTIHPLTNQPIQPAPPPAIGWGAVCSAYSVGMTIGTYIGRWALRRSLRARRMRSPLRAVAHLNMDPHAEEDADASFSFLG